MAGKILVVEDNISIREIVSDVLAAEGYDVKTAADGREAQLALASDLPKAILLDLMMPVMDGWAFLEWLHSEAEKKQIPVIVTTAVVNPQLDFQVAQILRKPLDLEKLLNLLENLPSH